MGERAACACAIARAGARAGRTCARIIIRLLIILDDAGDDARIRIVGPGSAARTALPAGRRGRKSAFLPLNSEGLSGAPGVGAEATDLVS